MTWQRHFLALLPDDAARAQLLALPLPAAARRNDPADLHVTLAFLGTLDDAALAAACDAAASAIRELPPPQVRLDHLEHWTRARALCATCTLDPDPLSALAARIAGELTLHGLPIAERAFRSHATLARLPAREAAPTGPLPEIVSWRASQIALLASRGDERLPRYDLLRRFPFAGVFSPPDH